MKDQAWLRDGLVGRPRNRRNRTVGLNSSFCLFQVSSFRWDREASPGVFCGRASAGDLRPCCLTPFAAVSVRAFCGPAA